MRLGATYSTTEREANYIHTKINGTGNRNLILGKKVQNYFKYTIQIRNWKCPNGLYKTAIGQKTFSFPIIRRRKKLVEFLLYGKRAIKVSTSVCCCSCFLSGIPILFILYYFYLCFYLRYVVFSAIIVARVLKWMAENERAS